MYMHNTIVRLSVVFYTTTTLTKLCLTVYKKYNTEGTVYYACYTLNVI